MSFFKKLFSGRSYENVPVKEVREPQTIEDLFQADLDSFPDSTFSMSRQMNSMGDVVVSFGGRLQKNELGIFDSATVNTFESGESTIIFIGTKYTASQYSAIIEFFDKVYKILGADSKGNTVLSADDRRNLLVQGNYVNLGINIFWENENHYHFFGELDGEISFSVPRKLSERIRQEFFLPNATLTKYGLLPEIQAKFDRTVAVTEYDEFTKKRSYKLVQVAECDTPYLLTYNLDSSLVAALSGLSMIALSFSYSEGLFFLHIISSDKRFPLDKGDSIIFLFEDESTIELETLINKIRTEEDYFRTVITLSSEQMKDFALKKLKKWKVTSNKNALFQIGGFPININITQYRSMTEGQYLLQVMAKTLVRCILEYEKEAITFGLPEGE